MIAFRTLLACVALLGITAAAWVAYDAQMTARDAATQKAFQEEREQRMMAEAVRRQKQLARQQVEQAALEKAWRASITQQWGSPIEAALKNPDAGIAQSLEALVRAVVPSAEEIAVRVERFVEFQVVLRIPEPVGDPQLARWCQSILTPMHRYLHAIRFVAGTNVLGELSQPGIEAVVRRGVATEAAIPELIRQLHIRDSQVSPPEVDRIAGPVAVEAPNALAPRRSDQAVDPESENIARVHQELTTVLQDRSKEFAEGLRDLHGTLELLGREGPAGLKPAREVVQRFRERLPALRVYLTDPGSELDRRLQEARVDEVYRRAAVRTIRQEFASARDGERMIAQVRRYADVLLGFLDVMEKHRAGWIGLPEVRKIQFLDSDLFEIYREAVAGCEREQKETQAAVERWQTQLKSRSEPGNAKKNEGNDIR